MARVPVQYQRLYMISERVRPRSKRIYHEAKGDRAGYSEVVPLKVAPRWEKVYAVARAEGIYDRWTYRHNLEKLLGRHVINPSVAGHTAYDTFMSEKNILAFDVNSLSYELAKIMGIELGPDRGFLELRSHVTKAEALEMVQELKFNLGSCGAVVEQYPATHYSYALVRIHDMDLFKNHIRKGYDLRLTPARARLYGHPTHNVQFDLWMDSGVYNVVSDQETQRKMSGPKPRVDYSRWEPGPNIEDLERQLKEIQELCRTNR